MIVTEQVIAREEIQKALEPIERPEEHLRHVVDAVPALVWLNQPDGATEFFNQQYLDYTGLSNERALRCGLTCAVHPDDVAGLLEAFRTIWTSGSAGEAEARLRRLDGEYRWFLFRTQPLRDQAGKVAEWYGAATDIEDRKRTEAALRESEQRFRDYVETATDWLWETGPDHRFCGLSLHSKSVGILASGLIVGLLRWEIATDVESEPEKWLQHRETLAARLPFRDLVYRTVSRDGSPIYIRTSGKPFYDASGDFLGYRGVATDVTATIRAEQAEQALHRAQMELAHITRVTTLGELTASLSHEVNQPLAAIVANAGACLGWLGCTPPNLEAARRSVEWIIDDGNRATEVIRRIRTLAKKAEVEMVPLDLNDVVREVMAIVQRELISHEVSLRMELAPTLPKIFGDRVQLQQVIINLVTNGIEAMSAISDWPRELVIRSGQEEMDRVFLAVTDCGAGISAENVDLIFNPFFTTKSGGMGMGLAICRAIMEAHGGRLSASRNDGPGATFQFVMPPYQGDAS